VIGEVRARFERVAPASLPVPSEEALRAAVQGAAEAVSGPLRLRLPPPAGVPSVRLTVELETGWLGHVLRSVVRVHLLPVAESPNLARVDREALVEKEDVRVAPDAVALRAHVEHALELVVGGAVRAEQLWLAPPADARAALGGSDADLRDEAIRIAAERRDRETVPVLIKLLMTDDAELRDRAVGALAEIGDIRAVRPLADLAKFSDVTELVKVLDAISRLGGPEAESYLELVAGGHPSAEVRDLAKRALDHLRSRADRARP
jgi:hypothetical protein